MSRSKVRSISLQDFFAELDCPSDKATKKIGDKVATLPPFLEVKAVEKSLAYKIAIGKGMRFRSAAEYLQKNATLDMRTLTSGLQDLYVRYQADVWNFGNNFNPDKTIKTLIADINEAVTKLQQRSEERRAIASGR